MKKSEEGEILATTSDFCEVFAIPTSRLKSIEYVQVSGSPPPNDTRFLAQEVDLSEPFSATVSTNGASDDDDIKCQGGPEAGFTNTTWYRFTPSADGTLRATVTSDADLKPVVGIWEELEEGILDQGAAPGSGPGGSACQTAFKASDQGQKKVATIANGQREKTYLIAMGTQNDKGGTLNIALEFIPGASFLYRGFPQDELPQVALPSGRSQVQLELRLLDDETYELRGLGPDNVPCSFENLDAYLEEFSLVSDQQENATPTIVEDQEDETRTLLETELVNSGTWTLEVPKAFVGQVRLTTTVLPDLLLAFADTSVAPLDDIRVQRALLLLIDETSIRDSLGLGRVTFDSASIDPDALTLETGEDAATSARELLAQAEVGDELAVQIQAEPESEERQKTLLAAAEILRQQLLAIGLDITVEACKDVCIRVFFFGSEAQDAP